MVRDRQESTGRGECSETDRGSAGGTVGGLGFWVTAGAHTEMKTQHFFLAALNWNQMLTPLLFADCLTVYLPACLTGWLTLCVWLPGCVADCIPTWASVTKTNYNYDLDQMNYQASDGLSCLVLSLVGLLDLKKRLCLEEFSSDKTMLLLKFKEESYITYIQKTASRIKSN